ncbi:YhcH/YjgK/YiaL family protein [Polaribacter staleyi]|uniref:YhcH/YjgK/YiaL family protein n=1 Tax=Polaribacter staleyi TaxID=2022337 RepID=UPI0031BA40E1
MILDKIENAKLYFNNPSFKELFKQLKTYTVDTPNGVYKNHKDFYFKVMSYETKLEPTVIESHIKEVDVQILLSGSEKIKIYDSKDVEITEKYSSETDCQFYKALQLPISEIFLRPGYMAVFFPDDIHGPQYTIDNNVEKLKKIVIKIDEKLFS